MTLPEQVQAVPPERSPEAALSWLSLKAWAANGALHFCMTESGYVGLFDDGTETSLGTGDTAMEALLAAHESYHEAPEMQRCECETLEEQGDALP